MKLYADSADIDTVIALLEDHIITGVTTNPTILQKDGHRPRNIPDLHRRFTDAGAEEIFFQATGATRAEMQGNAAEIRGLGDRVIVKIPATAIGFRVAAECARAGAPVLLTAVYTIAQAVAAASIGARYIAPYFGRLDDSGLDALDVVGSMHRAIAGSGTNVLVASVRTPTVAANLALAGIGHITAHPSVIEAMLVDPASDAAAVDFEAAARV
ncbi:transaldolase family protein [Microbacterium invictum]|uniref:transaldolase family protein n=1 Tax=Microbacterium invictum TaxID=515415 RepID=UPI0027E38163|nr:transaldolase family protein [Microbacterium invictum]